ncbi:ribonuclease H-like domain-containing protein [Tanacetum coccineum]|uniref:Ribonuclease H-like domain-containing protein n=1 Tax=Tanacetum coccineum TaxID=301880 RepID=A0ABQ5B7H8_9ASTR
MRTHNFHKQRILLLKIKQSCGEIEIKAVSGSDKKLALRCTAVTNIEYRSQKTAKFTQDLLRLCGVVRETGIDQKSTSLKNRFDFHFPINTTEDKPPSNELLPHLLQQPTLSRSSAEAEYQGVVNVVAETTWMRNLLRELHTPLLTATLVYCDNVSAVYLSVNLVQHQQPNTLRLTFIVFVIWLLWVTCAFFTFHLVTSMPISSPKAFLRHYLKTFASFECVDCSPAQTAGDI